jgi:hypothetical protein
MEVCLPFPHFKSKGLENSQIYHHERIADETGTDVFYMLFFHTYSK